MNRLASKSRITGGLVDTGDDAAILSLLLGVTGLLVYPARVHTSFDE